MSGQVVCSQYNQAERVDQLRVFSAADGSLTWKSKEEWSGYGALAVDATHVYAMAHFKIQAYDLNNGHLLWESQEFPSHRSYDLRLDGEMLYVRDRPDKTYYLDVNTGDILDSVLLPTGEGFWLLAQLPTFDLHTSQTELRAVDKATQRVLWSIGTQGIGSFDQPPVLLGNVLLFGNWEHVLAVDPQTGHVRWRNQDPFFASNFVVVGNFLYALDYNARLVRLDVNTGQETGYIQFEPASTNVSEKRYWVAADRQMLFVSFGDSQELIALGP